MRAPWNKSRALWAALWLICVCAFFPSMAPAAEVRVAVAANFTGTLRQLGAQFERETGNHLLISAGSTGKLYVQIKNGAPFDVLLAADVEHPQRLEQEHLAVPGTRFTYARGVLVLWSPDPHRIDAKGEMLTRGQFTRLAIANPAIAPYGAAARQALRQLGLWDRIQARLVQGEDIGQTFQFVATHNADAGLVAMAQVREAPAQLRGSLWVVPPALYHPIEQQAVLLQSAASNAAARAFMRFLAGAPARRIVEAAGYQTAAP